MRALDTDTRENSEVCQRVEEYLLMNGLISRVDMNAAGFSDDIADRFAFIINKSITASHVQKLIQELFGIPITYQAAFEGCLAGYGGTLQSRIFNV